MAIIRLKDKVVIITGGGQGIGKVLSLRLAQEGAKVAVVNQAKAKAVADEIIARGQEAIGFRTDVSDEESTKVMVQTVMSKYGRIDVLVNNAAIFSTLKMKPFDEVDVEEWDAVMAVNLKGVFLCCKAVAPIMKTQKHGKIINMGASAWFFGRPYYIHYTTSKAGLSGLTRTLARELGDWNINVNMVTPGAVRTEISRDTVTPEQVKAMVNQRCIKREEVPEDLVGAVIFLASEESDFISGQTINVDGGYYLY